MKCDMTGISGGKKVLANEWLFIEDLKRPVHEKVSFSGRERGPGEADLSNGISLDFSFPDPEGLLETAFADFRAFLAAAGIAEIGYNGYEIAVREGATECFEAFKLLVDDEKCVVEAADTEGIRRGLVYLEDEILRSEGPFLAMGAHYRRPMIKTRISRCFFGPIKRPPMNRDELLDDLDYYPEEYLNRLTHEGVNALWLSVSFNDLCVSDIFPDQGADRERRYAKLRRTVAKCARYGIKIYPFIIEPFGFGPNPEYQRPLSVFADHPELAGHQTEKGSFSFCVSSETGKRYLEDCSFQIFSNVPGLGGLIDISMGERPTHCYSWVTAFEGNNCPRCSKRAPWEVVNDTVSSLAKGMRKANPEARMISWLYVPQFDDSQGIPLERTASVLKDIAAHIPPDITFQFNFESMGIVRQLGKERRALDYFLSWPGPSELFASCAKAAVSNGAEASAKIQVGCSHELATIPFIPVPANLYEKYKAMRELGVSSVMQCWYFGNYPGLMNKAAGELSFEPFPESSDDFLAKLAAREWGDRSQQVLEAWKRFQESYSNFPVNLGFTHYGPLHHSVVWPLHLFPVDQPISPSWKFTFPLESGDRIGECLCYDHTLDEALVLLDAMAENWRMGAEILKSLRADFAGNRERLMDISLANAINLQMDSAKNVFHFYDLRERLPFIPRTKQMSALGEMKRLVEAEMENSSELAQLCEFDPRLGFHSEAEGYKYDAPQLKSRVSRLRKLLDEDFPKLRQMINAGAPIFPEYIGAEPSGKQYGVFNGRDNIKWEKIEGANARWNARIEHNVVVFTIGGTFSKDDKVTLIVEPRRLWPAQKFIVSGDGAKSQVNYKVEMDGLWYAIASHNEFTISIPLELFDGFRAPGGTSMRVNVGVNESFWIERHPLEARLRFSTDNPADLGWLLFL